MNLAAILLVEDDPRVREYFVRAIEAHGYLVIAHDCAESALSWVQAGGEAGTALVDLGLPGMDGVTLIKRLLRLQPTMAAIVLTVFDDSPTITRALRAGARGYLLKDATDVEFAAALHDVASGKCALGASIAERLVEYFHAQGLDEPSSSVAEDLLTPREHEVLMLLVRGVTYTEVGEVLGIRLGTVQTYVKSIYAKLEVTSKTEAAAVAVARKIVKPWA